MKGQNNLWLLRAAIVTILALIFALMFVVWRTPAEFLGEITLGLPMVR